MTDARRVADALSALADGTAPDSVEHRTVVTDAADAATDVRDAAQFVAGGGRGRLRLAVRTAERVGDRDAAERGRRTLDAFARFRATAGDAERLGPRAHSEPLRSRNDFTPRRSSRARRK